MLRQLLFLAIFILGSWLLAMLFIAIRSVSREGERLNQQELVALLTVLVAAVPFVFSIQPTTVSFHDDAVEVEVDEGAEELIIPVTLDGRQLVPLVVDYRFVTSEMDNQADSEVDFDLVDTQLRIRAFQKGGVIRVKILEDEKFEGAEKFTIVLEPPGRGKLGEIHEAEVTVIDNEDPPLIEFSDERMVIQEAANDRQVVEAMVQVRLSEESELPVSVEYRTEEDRFNFENKATFETDYGHTSGILTFKPGVVEQEFPVKIYPDLHDERDEFVKLVLFNNQNGRFEGNSNELSGRLEIQDNDDPPLIEFSQPTFSVSEDQGEAEIAVRLKLPETEALRLLKDAELAIQVEYDVRPLPFREPEDFEPLTGILTFLPGEREKSILVNITDDDLVESDDQFVVVLHSAINGTLPVSGVQNSAEISAVVTIRDDDRPVVSFADNSVLRVAEGGENIPVDLSLQPASEYPVKVEINIEGDPAAYEMSSGVVVFDPGSTEAVFELDIRDNESPDPERNLVVGFEFVANSQIEAGAFVRKTIVIEDNERLCENERLVIAQENPIALLFGQGQAEFYREPTTADNPSVITNADLECVLALPTADSDFYHVVTGQNQQGWIDSRQVEGVMIARDVIILPANLRSSPSFAAENIMYQVSRENVRGFVCAYDDVVSWLKVVVVNPNNPAHLDVGWLYNSRINRNEWEELKAIINSGEIDTNGGVSICES